MKLTIGMPHFKDYDGAFFTIQALKMYQDLEDCEILVIDNSPGSPESKQLQTIKNWGGGVPTRIIEAPNLEGPAQAKEMVFQEALGEAVMCIDCHILLSPECISKLKAYYAEGKDEGNLLCGPIIYDDLQNFSTHFDGMWRGQMFGVWSHAWSTPDGRHFCCRLKQGRIDGEERPGLWTSFHALDLFGTEIDLGLGEIDYTKREDILREKGCFRLGEPDGEPFEIPSQGCGLMSCRKDVWPGFNKNFKGFGGEEGYIHEKFRQHGKKVMCLPFMRWNHRFGRPGGVQYPLRMWNRIRNYVLGFQELNLPLDSVREHFVGSIIPEYEFDRLVADPLRAEPLQSRYNKVEQCLSPPDQLKNIEELWQWVSVQQTPTKKYLPYIRSQAEGTVLEVSDAKETSIALAAAKPEKLISIHQQLSEWHGCARRLLNNEFDWKIYAQSALVEPPQLINFLLINTQDIGLLKRTLNLYGDLSDKVCIHHYIDNGHVLETIRAWFENRTEYFVSFVDKRDSGLIILSRKDKDRPPVELYGWVPDWGAGTELKKLLHKIGIRPSANCRCNARAAEMNRRGIEWCESHIETILDWLKEEADRLNLPFIRAAAKMVIRLAIRRAKKVEKGVNRERIHFDV